MTYTKMLWAMISFSCFGCFELGSDDTLTVGVSKEDDAAVSSSELVECSNEVIETVTNGVRTCKFLTYDKNKDSCVPVYIDTCCFGKRDKCGYEYGEDIGLDFLGYSSHSNGDCTGDGSGEHQCAIFVQGFYSNRLNHSFGLSWGSAKSALDRIDPKVVTKNEPGDLQSKTDPVFVFRVDDSGWTGAVESPRETDALVFSGGGFGHIVVAMKPEFKDDNPSSMTLPIIEENVANKAGNGPGGSCHHRVLVGTKTDGKWMIGSGFEGYRYTGFIRHNLAGIYADNGWHDDGTSKAFRDAYLAVANGTSGKILGWAFSDHEGSPFVHTVHGVTLQNFVNTNTSNRFGTDGQTALALSKDTKKAYLLKEGFWGAYKCIPGSDGEAMGGAEYLGAPKGDEMVGKIDGDCNPIAVSTVQTVTYQLFEGGCMWWRGTSADNDIHVHTFDGTLIDEEATETACTNVLVENNPPSADCVDDCEPGEQECNGTGRLNICGDPGTDSCYHWLTLNCSSDTTCVDGECVTSTSTPVTVATSSGSGGTSSVSGSGGASSINEAECAWHERRCVDGNRAIYQLCLLDTYSGETYWETIGCSEGLECTGATGVCSTTGTISAGGSASIVESESEGGQSSVGLAGAQQEGQGGTSSQDDSSQGGTDSVGGTVSQGGELIVEEAGTDSVSSSGASSIGEPGSGASSSGGVSEQGEAGNASEAFGGATSTSSSEDSSIGGAGFVNPEIETEPAPLHLLYKGETIGEHVLEGWWNRLLAPDDTWQNAFLEDCPDDDPTDTILECDLPIPSGYQGFLFQVHLPDGRYWGDQSEDVTGGHGETIGVLTLTKRGEVIPYDMIANPEGSMYFMGSLEVVPE